jgi:LuxR family transcriptional regulator
VAQALKALGVLCDRGFALAVHIRLIRPTLLYQTYSEVWAEHYSVMGYMIKDPVVGWGLGHAGMIRWSDLSDPSMDPAGVMKDAERFGLTNGWTYSTGPASSRTISGTTKSGTDFTEAERNEVIRLVDAIHAATEGFDGFPGGVQQALRDLGHRG